MFQNIDALVSITDTAYNYIEILLLLFQQLNFLLLDCPTVHYHII